MQIYMQCDQGEIEVFLCPEEETGSSGLGGASSCESGEETCTDTESEASPLKALGRDTRIPLPSPPPRLDFDEESRSSDIGQIRNALISASEDFGPMGNRLQLQTLDQENGEFDWIISFRSQDCTEIPRRNCHFYFSVLPLCCRTFKLIVSQ